MNKIIDISLSPKEATDERTIKEILLHHLNYKEDFYFEILKRSIDARSKNVKINLKISVSNKPKSQLSQYIPKFVSVKDRQHVVIAGCGPAGLFAALTLIEKGIKPVIFERGKNVRERRFDLARINKEGIVNPESNYCFGEGGAGTYSDGKLYTRSSKRGDVRKVLETFVRFGADKDILVNAHPHIGTNKLPKIIAAMRDVILEAGGEIHFESKITDIEIQFDKISSVQINHSEKYQTDTLILATGHSARDIFELLDRKKILIEAKPFAVGIRIEHPQKVIDKMQYHCDDRGKYLPPASYTMTQQIDKRGVYSFCMCPGGIIAPCATAKDEVVTNGWSPSKRNNQFANSGFVVSVELEDLHNYRKYKALAGMYFQKEVEQKCFIAGGKNQSAPSQRMLDFVNKNLSASLPECSYQPGIKSVQLHEILPDSIYESIRKAFLEIKKIKPLYFTNEAVCVAVESRTSSPVKIPRDKTTLQHLQIQGLYPCAEGAGYAGGIVSAAMDGMRIAETIQV
ncbi:MAG: NAD(P)/FAD-dependent oxidoreductase [Chitinophagales bacterium]